MCTEDAEPGGRGGSRLLGQAAPAGVSDLYSEAPAGRRFSPFHRWSEEGGGARFSQGHAAEARVCVPGGPRCVWGSLGPPSLSLSNNFQGPAQAVSHLGSPTSQGRACPRSSLAPDPRLEWTKPLPQLRDHRGGGLGHPPGAPPGAGPADAQPAQRPLLPSEAEIRCSGRRGSSPGGRKFDHRESGRGQPRRPNRPLLCT